MIYIKALMEIRYTVFDLVYDCEMSLNLIFYIIFAVPAKRNCTQNDIKQNEYRIQY